MDTSTRCSPTADAAQVLAMHPVFPGICPSRSQNIKISQATAHAEKDGLSASTTCNTVRQIHEQHYRGKINNSSTIILFAGTFTFQIITQYITNENTINNL